MKFIDFFSGIGGFRLGMEMAGHECVGHCEIDKYADISYRNMHKPKESEWFGRDVTTVKPDDLPQADVFCGGFPCQSFSIAGKRGGFADTRGTLFFEIMRLAIVRKPQYLFLENVKGLLSHDGGRTFGTILESLWECGYHAQWQILNSKYWVPQNRERIFIVGYLADRGTPQIFPITENGSQANELSGPSTNTIKARYEGCGDGSYIIENQLDAQKGINVGFKCEAHETDIALALLSRNYKGINNHGMTAVAVPVIDLNHMDKNQNGRRFKEDGDEMFTLTAQDRHGILQVGNLYQRENRDNPNDGRIYDPDGIAPCLNRMEGGNRQPFIQIKEANQQGFATAEPGDSINIGQLESDTRRGRVGKAMANTITTQSHMGVVTPELTIRKLTPRECFRLQGFPDDYFDRAAEVNSDSQLYKQAGNSVTVPVIHAIAKRLPKEVTE